ncbi:hypothetical protein [Cesiribacter sp. SM1]|uniref:hypothetical protein n=1 Tax=Cesiribacter sp. SM1 TaxID=2861196 RepID=UPI001CD66F8C|nr:hypothetical protein [Cesiribacter sp. SM1]
MSKDDNMETKPGRLSPMMKVIEDLRGSGYTTELFVTNGKLHDRERKEFDPTNMTVDSMFRFEGQSDPEYMGILYAVSDKGGTKGYISNAYGTYADGDTDEVIKRMNDIDKHNRSAY